LAGNFFFVLTSLDGPATSDAAEDTDDWEDRAEISQIPQDWRSTRWEFHELSFHDMSFHDYNVPRGGIPRVVGF
jgi:hypothetical protein